MRIFRIMCIFGAMMLTFPVLHAQDFLQKAKNYLDAGDCENAQKAYDAYKVEHPNGNAEVKRQIDDCRTTAQTSRINSKDLTFSVNGVTFKMVFVEGGTFQMGCTSEQGNCRDDEKPVHWVTLRDFYVGEFEVTQELWQAVMGTSIYQEKNKGNTKWPLHGVGPHYPMYYVTDYESEEFCSRLNHLLQAELPLGYKVALPSEAQWEYAARGGNKSKSFTYAGSNYISDVAYYENNSNKSLHEVGFKAPNELGLYDMSGNVWEMCVDWKGDYESTSSQDPRGPFSGDYRTMRGGSSFNPAIACRVACRFYVAGKHGDVGFRIALVHE